MTKGSASAVDKALDLLEAIARSTTPMKLSELAEEVGMLRPTAHRVLGELANRGWVFRYDGRYLPGPAALQVSHEAAAHSLAALCDPTMRVLSESTDMMVNLQVLESGGTRIIAALRPERLKMITRMLGDLLPPHRFAGPLALVAALEDNTRAPTWRWWRRVAIRWKDPPAFSPTSPRRRKPDSPLSTNDLRTSSVRSRVQCLPARGLRSVR